MIALLLLLSCYRTHRIDHRRVQNTTTTTAREKAATAVGIVSQSTGVRVDGIWLET